MKVSRKGTNRNENATTGRQPAPSQPLVRDISCARLAASVHLLAGLWPILETSEFLNHPIHFDRGFRNSKQK